jgi:hypothetical protein
MTASYHSATMASFQEEVADIITQLETTSTSDFKWNEQAFGVVGGSDRAIDEVLDQAYRGNTRGDTPSTPKEKFRQAAIEARSALKNKANRAAFCNALESVTQGSQDIANILVPAFLPMAVSGTIAIPAAPLVWALIAITIARIGVFRLCRQ